MKKIITLLPPEQARVGYEFVHYGAAEECAGCELYKVCIENLEKGRKYRVVDLREFEHPCRINEKVRVVEIEEADVLASLEKKEAFVGARINFAPLACERVMCRNWTYCSPEGLQSGERCEIREADKLECPLGKNLTLAKLRRV